MAARRKTARVEIPLGSDNHNARSSKDSIVDGTSPMAVFDSPPPFESPFLPTPLELAILSVYPATLIIGSLWSTITVNHAETPYIPHLQSYDPHNAPSYFAKKSNLFNIYFVKIGWAWITIAFALFVFGSRALGSTSWLSTPQSALNRRRIQAIARYALLTGVWFAFTQSFFGASLIDRGYRITGGKCEIVLSDDPLAKLERSQMSEAEKIATHAACKLIGGHWKGGHDISGHVFLLVMGSAMLWFEVLPVILTWAGLTHARRVFDSSGQVRSASSGKRDAEYQNVMGALAIGVAGLSWWMLLMTAAYFHTWFEKFTGLLVAFTAIYLTYFLPRASSIWRQVVGMPGV